jgi:hypothetical protein
MAISIARHARRISVRGDWQFLHVSRTLGPPVSHSQRGNYRGNIGTLRDAPRSMHDRAHDVALSDFTAVIIDTHNWLA